MIKTYGFIVSVEATRTFEIKAKSRKEALKILLEESFPYEIDYLLGDIEEESQIQEEYVL